jgi:hypothetical protein
MVNSTCYTLEDELMPEANFTTWAECPQKRWVIEVKNYVELPISFFPRMDNLEG